MENIQITKKTIDLWGIVDHLPDFADTYEIWQDQIYSNIKSIKTDYTGSIAGYVEPVVNKDYSYEQASGKYYVNVYTPDGELLTELNRIGDKLVQWAGLHKLPFVGYVTIESRGETALLEGSIWIIIPKSKEQMLSTIAAFYKRRKKKNEAPDIIGLSDFLDKPSKIGEVTDSSSFIPMRKRVTEFKNRPGATKKRIEEYRATAPDITDDLLAEAIKDKYKDFFVNNIEVAIEAIKETYRNELPLTIENVLQQLEYMIEDRKMMKFCKSMQHIYSPEAKQLSERANKVLEKIYNTACTRTCRLSEFADTEIVKYYNDLYKQRDISLAEKLNLLCCNYHCHINDIVSCYPNNFPPFRPYDDNGDVVFVNNKDKADKILSTQDKAEQNELAKKGCLLWIILIPSLIFGLLLSI